jgi:outer membrane protein TolC
MQTSWTARELEQDVVAARSDVDKALVTSLPRLTLTARYTRLSPISQSALGADTGTMVATNDGTEGPLPPDQGLVGVPLSFSFPVLLDNYLLQASVAVPLSDYLLRTTQAIAAASSSQQAAELQARAARLAAAADAKVLYYDWVRARLQQVVAEQSLSQGRAQHRSARLAFAAGRASQADVLRAESLVASAELLVERAKNLAILSEDRLRTAMHDSGSRRYQIGEDITAQAHRAQDPGDVESLYQEARRRRLELRALDHAAQSLRKQREVIDGGRLPRLEAFGNAYYANPNQRYFPQEPRWRATWDVGLQLVWSPNDLGTASADSRAFEAQRVKVEAQRRGLEDALRAEVVQAHQACREARVAMQTTTRGLRAAEEGYRVRRELFRHGRATSVEVIDAETNLLTARLEMINAQVNLLAARVRLEHAVGRDVQ